MFDLRVMFDLVVGQADSAVGVICVRCGYIRTTRLLKSGRPESAECPLCTYVGWRESGSLPSLAHRSPVGRLH
jgi:hypothetical protein